MNALTQQNIAVWLADFHLLALVLLAGVLAALALMRQPARRMAVAKATLGALAALALLCALPGWSMFHLATGADEPAAAPMAPAVESPEMEPTPAMIAVSPPAGESLQAAPNWQATVAPIEAVEAPVDWIAWTLGGYAVGSAAVLLWLASGAVLARRICRGAIEAPPELQRLLARIAGDAPIPRLLVSSAVTTPVAIGVWRPTIILPTALTTPAPSPLRGGLGRGDEAGTRDMAPPPPPPPGGGGGAAPHEAGTRDITPPLAPPRRGEGNNRDLGSILAHEWAHLQNGDLWTLAASRLLLVLLWPQPLYWGLRRAIRLDQETLADAAAAEIGGRMDYAEQLLGWARQKDRGHKAPRLVGAVGLWEGRTQLKKRVTILLNERFSVMRTCSRRWRAVCFAGMAMAAVGLSLVTLQPATQAADGRHTDAKAKELAVRAHQKAAALNELTALYFEVSYRNGDIATMGKADDYSLENLRKAFDEPVDDATWFRHGATLAWDRRHFLLDTHYPGLKSGDGEMKDYHQVYFGDMSEGWVREQSGDQPANYFRRPSIEALWNTSSLMAFKFLALTPREFWWGDNSGHNLGHNPVPPSMVDYTHMGQEDFDGELCDVVESKGRAERLWIGRKSGLIRGCMQYIYQGRMNTEFHESPVVERVAGRKFASSNDYREWYQQHEKGLLREQQAELTKVFCETYFDEMARESSLIVFSDYREIAPGVWLPFAEDRTTWHHHESDDAKYKYIRCETRVTKALLDVDLEAQVASLAPKAGARVQDQRFEGAVVEYPWRDDLTAEEIESLVQSKRLEMEDGRRLLEELAAPMLKLVGQPAPILPDEGWVGGRPQLTGKPYLIHFWATWCGPCKNDYELLNRVAKNRRIIGIHPPGTPQEKVEAAIEEAQLAYPTLISTESTEELVGGYPVKMYPYCVVVDPEGKVAVHGRLAEVAEAFGDLHE